MSRRVGCFFCRYASRVARIALNKDTITCKSNMQHKTSVSGVCAGMPQVLHTWTWMKKGEHVENRQTKKQIALQLRHSSDLVALFPCSGRCAHLSVFVINKQIPHSLPLHVWDLQPMRMADLLWLENRIQVLHGDDSFGSLRLGFVSEVENDTLVPYTAHQKKPL